MRDATTGSPRPRVAPTIWAQRSIGETMEALATSADGLSSDEARVRLTRFGPNALPPPPRRQWYVELGANFIHLFALLLWAGAALAWLAGMPQLACAIVAVIVINGLFSYWQEYQAGRATEALEALLPRQVGVRRDGRDLRVPAAEIVPGDVLVLEEGESVPADARLVSTALLRVDMSLLTGESRPVPRTVDVPKIDDRGAGQLPNLVFAGTTVARGRGEAIVFSTGPDTEFGRIAHLTQSQVDQPSPLQRELGRTTRLITLLALLFGVVAFVVGTNVGGLTTGAAFLFAVGIIVANVPEGLLPTLTLSLAFGVRRMAARKALVKRLASVETLGATTVVLTDKTGTLTENEMTVREVWAGGASCRVEGTGFEPNGSIVVTDGGGSLADATNALRIGALCCDAHVLPPDELPGIWTAVGDPTEAAILVAAAKAGITPEDLARSPRVAELPFDSVRRRMTTLHRVEGRLMACVKGAPGEIIPRCTTVRWGGGTPPMSESEVSTIESALSAFSTRGLRVLAVASRSIDFQESADGWVPEDVERELTFLGLLAMEDPPRPEVPAAVEGCRRAGVRVVMMTGDDGRTAATIAREIGLHSGDVRVVDGTELDSLSDDGLSVLLENRSLLFARATPEHKLRLVEAFQRRGDIVAATGDGVNDAPALKRADIGVAMGLTGTDVARESADMVLADDNFANIVAAIEEGRAVYDNVRKFVVYVVVSNVAEMAPFIAFILFHVPLPLTVMQILAVDLGTDLFPALALGMEKPEPDVMARPPRPRSERLFSLSMALRAYGWLGLIEGALALGGFFAVYLAAGWLPGEPMAAEGLLYTTATTMTLVGIVAGQVGAAFACRSTRQSIFQVGFTSNRVLLGGIALELLLLVGLVYVPTLASVFELAPPPPLAWVSMFLFGPVLLLLEEGRKLIRRRSQRA